MHEGKYIYYRCTHNQVKCPDKYASEEKIDELFTQSLDQFKINDDVLAWVVTAMGSASAECKKQREAHVMVSNQQMQRLEDRLNRMYLDKLDGIRTQHKCVG
jgi:hypothetical protein